VTCRQDEVYSINEHTILECTSLFTNHTVHKISYYLPPQPPHYIAQLFLPKILNYVHIHTTRNQHSTEQPCKARKMSRRQPKDWSVPYISRDPRPETTAEGFRLRPIGGSSYARPLGRLPGPREDEVAGRIPGMNFGAPWHQNPHTRKWSRNINYRPSEY
jgi:hypothetical protein